MCTINHGHSTTDLYDAIIRTSVFAHVALSTNHIGASLAGICQAVCNKNKIMKLRT